MGRPERRTLTPRYLLPTGHEVRRSEVVMRDKRMRRNARSTIKAKGYDHADR